MLGYTRGPDPNRIARLRYTRAATCCVCDRRVFAGISGLLYVQWVNYFTPSQSGDSAGLAAGDLGHMVGVIVYCGLAIDLRALAQLYFLVGNATSTP